MINNQIYSFYDISPFNIGIKKYNGEIDYIIIKGSKIPIKNNKTIKIDNENILEIYERNENDKNKDNLIGKINLNNIFNNMGSNTNFGFKEIKIEYELNDILDLFISILNGECNDKIKINLFSDKQI